ncbi:hypothetical protein GF342_03395 [Candidatus Woesearchaeota archaeon]|nr:hypothetical protein [Candidatus Woesearchaeota archaeon]
MKEKEIATLLNKALELEHQAYVQYLSHAQLIDGINAEPIIARLKELAEDERKHQEQFRNLIGNYLDEVPSMGIAKHTRQKLLKKFCRSTLKMKKKQ